MKGFETFLLVKVMSTLVSSVQYPNDYLWKRKKELTFRVVGTVPDAGLPFSDGRGAFVKICC